MTANREKVLFFDTTFGAGVKLFGVLCIADILAIVFQFVFTSVDELIGDFLSSFICIGMGTVVYVTMIYSASWQRGFRDIGLESRDILRYNPRRGFLIGLVACIPGLILYVLLVIGNVFSPAIFSISKSLFILLHAYPFFLVNTLIESCAYGAYLCFIFVIPLPIISLVGYSWGYNNKLIVKRLMYGKDSHTGDGEKA